jgi:malonyl-CoA O-methyltransferase
MPNWLSRRRAEPVELDVLDAYAQWADAYTPEAHNPLMQLEQQAVQELLPDAAGRRLLDLACGSGRHLKRLAPSAAGGSAGGRAIGLDFSRPMLARAASLGRPLVQADLLALPIAAGAFDLIVCGLAVGHVADLAASIREMARVLAAGGVLVYSDFHPFGALLGWKRTFRAADGAKYAARHHVHLYHAHQAACQAGGLSIEAVREPRIEFDHPYRGYPAVLVIRAVKP